MFSLSSISVKMGLVHRALLVFHKTVSMPNDSFLDDYGYGIFLAKKNYRAIKCAFEVQQ
jgi:hypothetical protein